MLTLASALLPVHIYVNKKCSCRCHRTCRVLNDISTRLLDAVISHFLPTKKLLTKAAYKILSL